MGVTIGAGTRLSGKYELTKQLGEGGMGVVWRARHVELGTELAVKVLRDGVLGDKEAVTRFDREARAAASLRGPHVTRIFDVGRHDDGAPYMVMELLEGSDLGRMIEATGAQPVAFAVDVVMQACEGMAEAHARNIVHRDLKPENLFITRVDGRAHVKILDFGISKFQADGDLRVTQTQTSFGTPLYMSPEQIRSTKNVDHRTDVWSLGVILYEALTGKPPFYAESATAVAVAVSVEKYVPLLEHRPDAPPELEEVVAKALEKDAQRRYQSVTELAEALEPFRDAVPSMGIPRPRPSTKQVALSNTMRVSAVDVPVRPAKRSTGVFVAGAISGIAALGLVAFFALRGAPRATGTPGTPATTATQEPQTTGQVASAHAPDALTVTPVLSASAAPSAAPSAVAAASSAAPSASTKKAGTASPSKTQEPATAPETTHPDSTPKPKPPERNPEFL